MSAELITSHLLKYILPFIDATFKTHTVFPLKRNGTHDWAIMRLPVFNPMTCHVTSTLKIISLCPIQSISLVEGTFFRTVTYKYII
jgi:hypothetical protein